jgi:hypothetical protein
VVANVSIPCPSGATAAQCAALNDAILYLKNHGNLECAAAGLEAEAQIEDGSLIVHENGPPGSQTYTWLGATGQDTQTGEYVRGTIIYDWGFQNGDLGGTVAHEIRGHQFHQLPDLGQTTAEYYGELCSDQA